MVTMSVSLSVAWLAETWATGLPASIVIGMLCLIGAAGGYAVFSFQRARAQRALYAARIASLSAELQREGALLESEPGSLLVWKSLSEEPRVRSGASDTLEQLYDGEKGQEVKEAIQTLSQQGSMFSVTAPALDGRLYHTYGKSAAGQAAVWVRDASPGAEQIYQLSAQLAQAETRLDALAAAMDAAPEAMWQRDSDLTLTWVNKGYLDAVDQTDAESVLKEQKELDRNSRDLAQRALIFGEAQKETRYVVIGGQRRAMDVTAVPLPHGVFSFARDVTELDELSRTLQQHLDAQRDTFNNLPVAVAIFGADQRLNFANKAYAELWGLDSAWLETRPSDGDILERLRDRRRLPEQRDFQAWKKERLGLYTRLLDRQKEMWHLKGGKTLEVISGPHPLGGLIFAYADVSDKVALESSFNQLTHVQRASLDRLSDAVAVFGADGRLKLHNSAFREQWQLREEMLKEAPRFADVFAACRQLMPDDAHWSKLTSLIASGALERKSEEGPFERVDGRMMHFATAPLPDGSLLITVRDVTDSVTKARFLEERNAALVAADRLKSDFISHVSYQLRTPLTSISGFAQMMKDGFAGPLSKQQAAYLDNIATASNTLETLINDILDLALIESGALTLDLEEVDPRAVLEDTRPLVAERAEKAQVSVVLELPAAATPIVADGKRLRQTIYNLLINAIENTPANGIVTAGVEPSGGGVRLFVQDTGTGMPQEQQAVAFNRFESGTKSKSSRRAGLGLALVHSFVQLHGGWVSLMSRPGQGTLVECHLPKIARQPVSEHAETADGRASQPSSDGYGTPVSGPIKSVAI